MNNQLIEKIITSNNLPCPTFTYENPVLDRNVAKTLAKSFVKILNISKHNSKINNNMRLNILENIRKLCQIEPENHIKSINEDFTKILSETYEQQIKTSNFENSDSIIRTLDTFLIRNMKEMNLNCNYKSPLQPETIQALINLNQNEFVQEVILKDMILWSSNRGNVQIIKNLWTTETQSLKNCEDIPIKMKSAIEKILIEICHNILKENKSIQEVIEPNMDLKSLSCKCSDSPNCFQISCSILNYIFIMTNFNPRIQEFIQNFIETVRDSNVNFSNLYSFHLSHIVVLLDTDFNVLPIDFKINYIQSTLPYLYNLHSNSENDFIMLLSHFPQWFDIYFEQSMSCEY